MPFCPESGLSGVGHKDFIEAMWYHCQIGAILSHRHICGYCCTQLTDVGREQNGIYN